MKLTFFGAAKTVTGSKFLVQDEKTSVLVDCGLFQGPKPIRKMNWSSLPIKASEIDAVILTHAHLDHSGYLPALVKYGFKGKVYCTKATRDLCGILLPDSGKIQEEDAFYANKKGFSIHKPALPLYTEEEAINALRLFVPLGYDETDRIGAFEFKFTQNGHILGSSFVTLTNGSRSIVFSGDVGRNNDLLMYAPRWIKSADYLVLEATYGNRTHDKSDLLDELEAVINRTIKRNGSVIIPAFAVGRAQHVLYAIHLLKKSQRIPNVPVFLNSPMAIDATELLCTYASEHKLNDAQCTAMTNTATYVHTVEESKELDQNPDPKIIISASGMATGGRVLHHLRTFAPDEKNTILFTGYQADGTRGASILGGASFVKMHGMQVPIRAEVAVLENLSAHADRDELLAWLSHFHNPPKKVFIVHGEEKSCEALKDAIVERFGWHCEIPNYKDTFNLK